jgi:hypothetical protein
MLTLSAKYYQRKYRLRKLYFGSTAGFRMISVIGKEKTLGDTGLNSIYEKPAWRLT